MGPIRNFTWKGRMGNWIWWPSWRQDIIGLVKKGFYFIILYFSEKSLGRYFIVDIYIYTFF